MSAVQKQLLRPEKVAEILNCKPWRVYDLARAGLLPVVRMGKQIRIHPDVLDEWIKNGGAALPDNSQRGKQSA